MAERGFDRTSINDIADRSRVAGGTVIYHFRSKERLLAELARRHLVSLHMHCRRACESGGTGLECINVFTGAVFDHLQRGLPGWRIFFREIAPNRLAEQKELHEPLETAGRLPVIHLENLIIVGQMDGSIGPCDPFEAATAVWAVIMGCIWSVLFQECGLSFMARNAAVCSRQLLAGREAGVKVCANMYPKRGEPCSRT